MRSDTAIFRAFGPAQTLTTTSASAVRSTAVNQFTQHVEITATVAPVWVAFGDSAVTAAPNSGVVVLAGQTKVYRITGGQFVSVVRIGATDATVYISELCY